MTKILGLRVITTGTAEYKPARPHVVWCGFTEKERDDHRQFILDRVFVPKFDGHIHFEDVEDEVTITREGRYHSEIGELVIDGIRGVRWHGRMIVLRSDGTERYGQIVHGYVNGQSAESGNKIIIGMCDEEEAA